jgi:hypothetical protein
MFDVFFSQCIIHRIRIPGVSALSLSLHTFCLSEEWAPPFPSFLSLLSRFMGMDGWLYVCMYAFTVGFPVLVTR